MRKEILMKRKEKAKKLNELMKKLNKGKIKWIIKEMKRGELSVHQIAKLQKISRKHVWRVFYKYRNEKNPKILHSGRKLKKIPEEERKLVLKMRKDNPVSPVGMEILLEKEKNIHIPHNRIYRIFKEAGYVKNQPNKQKRRRWIRYERRHSNSLWHSDWSILNRKNLIIFEDDASRIITSYGFFKKATSDHAIEVFEAGVREFGTPKQLHTDHEPSSVQLKQKERRKE